MYAPADVAIRKAAAIDSSFTGRSFERLAARGRFGENASSARKEISSNILSLGRMYAECRQLDHA